MNFHGVKVAIIVDGKLLMHLRDNKPGLFNANMWDFPGGGREGSETVTECAVREVKEEFELNLSTKDFVWQKDYPAQKDPTQKAYFIVAHINKDRIGKIILHEGQDWDLITQEDFFIKTDVIDALKSRFSDYLNSK
jgi:8-oxo-dGTP diphosphatase